MASKPTPDADPDWIDFVDTVLMRAGVRNAALRLALLEIDRERFLFPEASGRHLGALPLPEGQSSPPLGVVARMIDELQLAPESRVLEIGTGTGYTAALLGRMCARVFSVERLPALAERADLQLRQLGADNVSLRVGDGLKGWPEEAPFDAILISATAVDVPRHLLEQLAIGGRLVAPVGPHRTWQRLVALTRADTERFEETHLGQVAFGTRLGDILVGQGAAQRAEVEQAASTAAAQQTRIGEILLDTTRVSEADLYRALAQQRGLRMGSVDQLLAETDRASVEAVSRSFLEHYRMLPLRRDPTPEGGRALVATCDPDAPIGELAKGLNAREIDVRLLTPTDYRRLWTALDLGTVRPHAVTAASARAEHEGDVDLLTTTYDIDSRLVALFDALLLDAIAERASDIHLERYGEQVRVRLRVDGVLHDLKRFELTPRELIGLINVIKVSARLDIAERRRPQGGRLRRRAGDKVFDLRVQTQPALYGEHAVIRILAQDVKVLSIEELGFPPMQAAAYRRLIASPQGLVLVVGPTGSGKTTTLYAALQVLGADVGRKVITVEEPIEYSIDGVQQTQVNRGLGFGFADAMRSFVRQDPDAILVGEIRDPETALEAIRASQTGHLVLSTLHCNDAVDAVQRLFDLGMHPNSIASELLAVLAQRLAKRICTACRVPAAPEPGILAELFPEGAPEGFACYRGAGCVRCQGHGTFGRVALVEYLGVNATLRRAIARHLILDELRDVALDAGMIPMRDVGVQLVGEGLIPLSELPRILPADRLTPSRRPETASDPSS